MNEQRRYFFITILMVCSVWSAAAKEPPTTRVRAVVTARRVRMIASAIRVENATDRSLLIPTCGETDGSPELCTNTLEIEVYEHGRWRTAHTCADCSLVGGVMPKTGVSIPPGGHVNFEYLVAEDLYQIRKGQQARLILKAWKTVASLVARDTSDDIISSDVFIFP